MNIPYGYVYRIRNKINGKTYIGQRKLALDKSWRQYMGSGVLVKAAIVKYGLVSFTKELLAYANSFDELNKLEVELMAQERKGGKAEYNLHLGSPVPQGNIACKNLTPAETEAVYKALAEKTKERTRQRYEECIGKHGVAIFKLYQEFRSCLKVAKHLNIPRSYVTLFLKENNISLNHQNIAGRSLDETRKKKIAEGMLNSSVRFTKECNICGVKFETKSFNRITCIECIPKREAGRSKNKSKKRDSQTPAYQKKLALGKVAFTCNQCGIRFERSPDRVYKYCSKKCAAEGSRKELPPIETIKKLYWDDKLSANQIGAQYGVSGQTIRKYMKKNGIDRRAERHHL